MDPEEVQAALAHFEDLPEFDTEDDELAFEVIRLAARLVADPNIEAAAVKLANNGKLRPLTHIGLTELPALYEAIAEDVVAAAFTPPGDKVTAVTRVERDGDVDAYLPRDTDEG